MSTLTVDVLGTAVAIAVPGSLRQELRAALVDLEPATGAQRDLALVPGHQGLELRDCGRIVRQGVEPAIAVATVVWRLNAIANESSSHLLLHAAGIARSTGDGVLLVGGSGAGKSTLAAACVGGGFAYLSDELAAIDCRTGTVAPYAKPLVLSERLVAASSLGPVATSPCLPGAIVFPRYEPGASVSEDALEPGWALTALAAHTTNLGALGGTGLACLAGMALAHPAVLLTHGDARAAVAAVERCAHRASAPPKPAPVLPRLTPDTTAVALGDSLAVLHEPSGQVHVLNSTAAAIWRAAVASGVDGRAESHVVNALVDAPGASNGQRVRSGLIAALRPEQAPDHRQSWRQSGQERG
jgi:hypothetical protein